MNRVCLFFCFRFFTLVAATTGIAATTIIVDLLQVSLERYSTTSQCILWDHKKRMTRSKSRTVIAATMMKTTPQNWVKSSCIILSCREKRLKAAFVQESVQTDYGRYLIFKKWFVRTGNWERDIGLGWFFWNFVVLFGQALHPSSGPVRPFSGMCAGTRPINVTHAKHCVCPLPLACQELM